MKLITTLSSLTVVFQGTMAVSKLTPKRLTHHRLMLRSMEREESSNRWVGAVRLATTSNSLSSKSAGRIVTFLEDEAFWSHRFMQEFSTALCISLGTSGETSQDPKVSTPTSSVNPQPAPGPTVDVAPSPASPTVLESQETPGSPTSGIDGDVPSDAPSDIPSSAPTPTTFQSETVFGCSSGGVQQVPPPYQAITILSFEFEYLVESLTTLGAYQDRLESLLFLTAISGALQCSKGTALLEEGAINSVNITTTHSNGTCASNIEADVPAGISCYHMITSFDVAVAEDLDSTVAVFLGYIFLRDEMDGGLLENEVPEIVRGQYLGPLPTLPTNVEEDDDSFSGIPPVAAESRLTVSAWTVGAVVAMSVGGVLALAAWFRNRRTRNRRHMHLIEEMSMASPSSEA